MKKIMLFAVACVALAACSKEIDTTPETVTSFEKGQTVTLTVKTGDQTKVSSELVTTGEEKDKVNFKWEDGDKIKVTVGSKSAEFILSSGAGSATAEFTGTMPATGETFDVQYPAGDDPDLSSQTYVANALPKDKMKMAATDCTLGTPFTLTPQYSAIRLNLYGTSKTISKIIVKDASSNTYTLTINPAVLLPTTSATAQAFLIVVPVGNYKFSAEIFDNAATPASICKFEPSAAQIFSAAGILNMSAKEVKQKPQVQFSIANPSGFSNVLTGTFKVDEGTTWDTFAANYNAEHPSGPSFNTSGDIKFNGKSMKVDLNDEEFGLPQIVYVERDWEIKPKEYFYAY